MNEQHELTQRLKALQLVSEKVLVVAWMNNQDITHELLADLADENHAAYKLLKDLKVVTDG